MSIFKILKQKTKTILTEPKAVPKKVLQVLLPVIGLKLFVKYYFRLTLGYKLDLNNPKTFNEKLNWLKIYYRDPLFPKLVDKYEVKKYVVEKIGQRYVIENYGVWSSFEEINFDELPNQFVLKTTHDGGGIVICKDKRLFDREKAGKVLNTHLKTNHYDKFGEWVYKNIKPRILAEKYMVDESGYELKDFKFFCFDGKVKFLFVATDRYSDTLPTKFNFFDDDFQPLPVIQGHPKSSKAFVRPENFDKMKELAEVLAKDIPHARIDLYNIGGMIKFGEVTFFHFAATMPFQPHKWDYKFGEYLNLPQKNN